MIRLAFHNLFQNKIRFIISVGGVVLAMTLILSLDAVFTGVERQITAYIDNSGADIFVSQKSVRNMHMTTSSMSRSVITDVEEIPGIEKVTPILYLTNMVVSGKERNLAYIIGLPENAPMGGPWKLFEGRSYPRTGETIIDRNIAQKSKIGIGDDVEILGRKFKVVGLSEETTNLVNSVAFISISDFIKLWGNSNSISYLLIKINPEKSSSDIAAQIEANVKNVTAQVTADFSSQERRVVKDMSTEVITMMNFIGFLIGLAVMALTVYTSTLAHRSEYGVLKALGAHNKHLYQTVISYSLLSVLIGLALGIMITFLLSIILTYLRLNLTLAISGVSLLKVSSASLVIAAISAILPIKQIAGLDPAMVFRGK